MITVFGSINVDIVSRVAKSPQPGETVMGSDYQLIAGGKGANQALAARRAGAKVRLVGAIGDDDIAGRALTELDPAGVDLSDVAHLAGTTGVAIITVNDAGENTIVVSPGANARVSATQVPPDSFSAEDTLLLQMEVPHDENRAVARRAAAAGARVVLSLAPFSPIDVEQLDPASIVIVNEHEAADFARHLGLSARGETAVVTALARRLNRTVIATLGPEGAVASGPDGLIRVPALAVTPVDTTGAGDTFAGVLAAYLDEGATLEAAMAKAAIAGSLACTKHGAQPSFPTRAEIEAAI
ncbi:ribokinase [Bauldia litoralis]|uniref:Ribokinase n=1 Tax=Bauldia litoralis TaxID=665467 RepID=A0A1G6AGK1_9HYPH|nr:ribokinase [Bauldia litoralis]SDB07547.1 ribokinase [Bauldia litoralis]